MFETVAEIKRAVQDKGKDMSKLRSQMESDWGLWALEQMPGDEAKQGYRRYTSSAPKNYSDKMVHGINRAQMTIQIKLPPDASDDEKDAANVGEMYLHGSLQSNDRRLAIQGEPPLREGCGFLITLRGWIGLRCLVYVPEGGDETVFDIQPWDIMHTTWDKGPNGLLWACRTWFATRAQIFSEWGIETHRLHTQVWDWFDEKNNAVIVGNQFGKNPTEHHIEHVPVYVGPVGSIPTIQSQSFGATLEHQGAGAFAASRGLYGPRNMHIARLMDITDRAAVGSIVYESEKGDKKLEGDPWQSWQEISVARGDSVKPLVLPNAPAETAVVLEVINTDLEQSTLPSPLAWGGTSAAMSGRALAHLSDATRSVYSPRTGALASAYRWLCEELLAQFRMKGIKPVSLSGHMPTGAFFQNDVKPTEIDKSWFVSVKVEPKLPRDEEKEIMMAKAATTPSTPGGEALMSMDTAREMIMKLDDPGAERDKVLAEMGETLPPIMMANIAKALDERGQPDLAKQVLALMAPGGTGAPGAAAPPPEQPAEEEIPPQVKVIRDVVEALQELGQEQLASELVQALQSEQGPSEELITRIIDVLVQAGEENLARAFIDALRAGMPPQGGPAGPQGPQGPTAPPSQDQRLANVGLAGPRG